MHGLLFGQHYTGECLNIALLRNLLSIDDLMQSINTPRAHCPAQLDFVMPL